MANVLTGEILKDLISEDKNSKAKLNMEYGENYYIGKNDITKYDFQKFYVNDTEYVDNNKANTKIQNNFHKKLVDQKRGYIAGKPITLSSSSGNEEYVERIFEVLGREMQDKFMEWIKGACNKGYENLHPYIDVDGAFDYAVITARETIYISEASLKDEVLNVIRYYEMAWKKNPSSAEVTITRAEVWDSTQCTYYWQENKDEDFKIVLPGEFDDIPANPVPHWKLVSTDGTYLNEGWGRVPFVKLRNNTEETTDLEPIKDYIDAVDLVSSGFINDLKDIQSAIWVLRGYDGEDLGEFMLNLRKFKSIKLGTHDNSSAEPTTLEIPKEARVAILQWLENKIYQIGQGVNESDLASGNITNVVIKAHYTGLDIKANTMIVKLKNALYEFLWFVTEYINSEDKKDYDVDDLEITFNKSMIFNELEIVQMINQSAMTLSKRTLLANHPFVEDVDDELEEIAKERQAALDNMGFGDEGDNEEE